MIWSDIAFKVAVKNRAEAEAIALEASENGIYIEDYSNVEQEAMKIAHIDLIDEDLLKKDRHSVIIHIYVPNGNPDEASSYIGERYSAAGIDYSVSTKSVKEEDWANNWKKYFHQLEVGKKMIICPSWEKADNPNHKTVLYLEPGLAFGTGTHPTTRLCLEVLQKYINYNSTVLDIGCGSGILAISAKLLGAKSVLGIDIDEKAVKTARENAQRNGCTDVKFIEGDLTDKAEGRFSVVAANIVADVIVKLCLHVKQLMTDGGIFIAGGIIEPREPDVLKAFEDNGFGIIERNCREDWVSYVLKDKRFC